MDTVTFKLELAVVTTAVPFTVIVNNHFYPFLKNKVSFFSQYAASHKTNITLGTTVPEEMGLLLNQKHKRE